MRNSHDKIDYIFFKQSMLSHDNHDNGNMTDRYQGMKHPSEI